MENITMTIDATHMSRVRTVCPEVGLVLLAGSRGWVQGTTGPAHRRPCDHRCPGSDVLRRRLRRHHQGS